MASRFKERLRRLEASALLNQTSKVQVTDLERDRILIEDQEANELADEISKVIENALKDRSDAAALYADVDTLLAALDVPTLTQLFDCMQKLEDRVNALRKKPVPMPS
jgi:methionine synthase II (cobalamin-independent)